MILSLISDDKFEKMKKFSTLFSAAMLAFSAGGFAQTAFQEDFNATTGSSLPAGWTQKKVGTIGWFTASGAHSFGTSGFSSPDPKSGRYAVIDDWANDEDNDSTGLITPSINLTGVTGAYLTFDAWFAKAKYNSGSPVESAWVSASTDNGVTWTVLQAVNPETSFKTPHSLNSIKLTAYDNAPNVMFGFFYSDNKGGTSKLIGMAVDNIKVAVPAVNQLQLTGVNPDSTSYLGYGLVSTTIPIGGEVYNWGSSTVTSYKVHYQLGSNAVVTDNITGVSIAPFSFATFTNPTALALPATQGTYPVKMWVELAGDTYNADDSAGSKAGAAAFIPKKRILVEEGTGTWCGWCPRGAVYMDSIAHIYASNFTLVAVHNRDPMTVTAYDSYVSGKIGGYPSVLVDRREVLDPSDLLDVYTNENAYFGFADMSITDLGATSFNLSVKVSVKPALDLSGDYRLALVLTENNVVGQTSGGTWDQHNYYSNTVNNIPLVGAGHDWQSEPSQIAGPNMEYQFVGRAIIPSPTGQAGSLPATMTANTSYDYTFNTVVAQPYNRANMKIVALMIRNSDGAVMNSTDLVMPLGISNVSAGVEHLTVYPNPATDVAHLNFNLNERAQVSVQVLDALGRVVNAISEQQFEKGAQKININTASLASGVYTIKLQTEKGSLTQQLSIAK